MPFKKGHKFGGFREGAGRKRDEIKAAFLEKGPRAAERIFELMESDNEKIALAASVAVVEHGVGKAAQPITGENGEGAVPISVTVTFVGPGDKNAA